MLFADVARDFPGGGGGGGFHNGDCLGEGKEREALETSFLLSGN